MTARPLHCYLLDEDDELVQGVHARMRVAARKAVTARVIDAEPGQCDLASWLAATLDGPGLLILDGVLAVDVCVGDRTATELVGPGDLLQPPDPVAEDLLGCWATWNALTDVRMALLDAAFAQRVRPWPEITQALLRRAGRRNASLDAQRAISCHPRLEVRLVLLLWHLASRWGRVEPGGIRLTLPVTHRVLGHVVGAERPSVSHALSRLAHAGLLTRDGSDWHLHGNVEDHIGRLLERQTPANVGVSSRADTG
ncbi:MAG TPA: Crp/Fnr family transcriptional regulator [Solirubrobacteraceae bacterium]|nr:Crp/Fnr family transcriptional regulator [Solirubrobacteraceae bacterium]